MAAWAGGADHGPVRLRDELFMKVAVLSLGDDAAARSLIHEQRAAHLVTLAELTALEGDSRQHPATGLLLEAAMLRLEADLRWLDLAEDRLKGAAP